MNQKVSQVVPGYEIVVVKRGDSGMKGHGD